MIEPTTSLALTPVTLLQVPASVEYASAGASYVLADAHLEGVGFDRRALLLSTSLVREAANDKAREARTAGPFCARYPAKPLTSRPSFLESLPLCFCSVR
jgi:hypothetical protein